MRPVDKITAQHQVDNQQYYENGYLKMKLNKSTFMENSKIKIAKYITFINWCSMTLQ